MSNLKKSNPDACPLAKKCGGCQLQNMTYPRQLKWKQAREEILLKEFGKVKKIIGMENPYHYRNKVQAAFCRTRSGKIISGVYQSGTHRIVMVDSCMIEDETADKIIVDIRNMLPKFKVQVYDEDKGTGFLRHVLVKRGFSTGEVMVVLVGASNYFPIKKKFVKALLEMHPEITTVVLNINPKHTNLVLGDTDEILYGPGYIIDTLCGLEFAISPKSFYQINPVQCEKLYNKAMEYAQLDENSTVIDAYCGIGTIGMVAAKTAGNVIGVELNKDAVKDAIANAKRNNMKNIRFFCDDAGDFMDAIASERDAAGTFDFNENTADMPTAERNTAGTFTYENSVADTSNSKKSNSGMQTSNSAADVVFMDPPRAGSSKKFISSMLKLNPKRIVYISCNPETLARDLRLITKGGYKVEEITPVDMFPHTNHVETVVSLVRYISTSEYITFEIRPDEWDLDNLNVGGTYENIKAYVKKKFGLNVSTLYIAQTKRKVGLDVGEAYMKSKKDDARVPKCPPEKEKAIIDALKYYGMI